MSRYKCIVEYDGTSFVGWQRQTNGYSIQEAIEESLQHIFQIPIRIFGSGRTDTGVHAVAQVFHFDLETSMEEIKITYALNHFLQKKNISILDTQIVKEDFDSRHDAILRTYEYIIINRHAPLAILKDKAWHVSIPLDSDSMQVAANLFLGDHDFTTFRAASCEATSPIRTIAKAEVVKKEDKITIIFASRSFLQHQVRSMVGSLKLVGEKKWTVQDLQSALDSKDRKRCGTLAPACGLYLAKVEY
jgi:tRNA pseudouridine38-40 synthase